MKIQKRTAALLLVGAAFTLLTQCSPKASRSVAANTPATEETPADKVAAVMKEFTPAQMEEGKAIFNSSCERCHKLKMPETRTVASWEKILPPMSRKAKLDEHQAALVRAYVLPLAKKG